MTETVQPTDNQPAETEEKKGGMKVSTILLWVAVIGILGFGRLGFVQCESDPS